jgi:hypothetical protein
VPAAKQQIPRADKAALRNDNSLVFFNLLLLGERARVKLHDFSHVGKEISQAVVAGIRVVLVLHDFCLKLPVKRSRAIFKSKVILLAAIKVDRQILHARLVLAGQNENAVFLPVRHIDRFAEGGSHQSAERTAGMSRV